MITDKKALDCIQTLIDFCDEQSMCENCIFREHRCDRWECLFKGDLPSIFTEANGAYRAKRKHGGYIT